MNSFLNPNRNQTTRVKYSSKKVSTITEVISKGNHRQKIFMLFFLSKRFTSIPHIVVVESHRLGGLILKYYIFIFSTEK